MARQEPADMLNSHPSSRHTSGVLLLNPPIQWPLPLPSHGRMMLTRGIGKPFHIEAITASLSEQHKLAKGHRCEATMTGRFFYAALL